MRFPMDIETLRSFLLACTIINGVLLGFWALMLVAAPGLLFRTQRKWFPRSQETFQLVMYCFLALFKILFLIFNLVPLIALLIVTR